MSRTGSQFAGRVTTVLLLSLLPGLLVGQAGQAGPDSGDPASGQTLNFTGPTLDVDHWAVRAAQQAEAIGLTQGYLPPQRAVPLELVERALRLAVRHAAGSDSMGHAAAEAVVREPGREEELAALTAGWYARLLEEYTGLSAAATEPTRSSGWLGLGTGFGIDRRDDAVAPGFGEIEPHRTGAVPLPDRTRVFAIADVAVQAARTVSLAGRLDADDNGFHLERFELAVGAGPVRGSVGRVPVGYGPAFGGGTMLTGQVALDAVQFATREPVRLPWLLGAIGPVTLHTFLGRMWEDRHADDPFIWGASGQFQPHRRLTIGVHRAAFFGGDPEQPVTFGRVVDMLIGRVAGIGFENQIVSASGRFVLPTERTLPLTAYFEWGAEDAAGGWWDVPGRTAGMMTPSLPFLPGTSAGIEYTQFKESCCGNPEWYRHWSFHGSWASRDRPLGHPLGGHGDELAAFVTADAHAGRLRLNGRGFRRDRGIENLYAPGRAGRSHGLSTELLLRIREALELRAAAAGEWGTGWSETRLRVEGRLFN